MKPFREIAPVRTYSGTHANYRDYKPHLAKDFKHKCGYTDCSDLWFGGKNNFHIDHFLPWKKYPHLKTDYSNLVYCCSYVNILKSNDEGTYLDPCNEDYNKHFQRDDDGNIIPLTEQAQYMYDKMKLYLNRFHIIWALDQLMYRISKLKGFKDILMESNDNESKNLCLEVLFALENHIEYLRKINE